MKYVSEILLIAACIAGILVYFLLIRPMPKPILLAPQSENTQLNPYVVRREQLATTQPIATSPSFGLHMQTGLLSAEQATPSDTVQK